MNLMWRKSSRSGNDGGDCVEVAQMPGGETAVRDSKHPDGPRLVFSAEGWQDFLVGVQDGDFDLT
jgi:hypothetical protein